MDDPPGIDDDLISVNQDGDLGLAAHSPNLQALVARVGHLDQLDLRADVLDALAAGPSTGYDIKARLEGGAAHFWHASYSQIYAELRRLGDLGLASEEHLQQDARPNKRVYTITREGRRARRTWLREPWGLAALKDQSLVKLTLADPRPRGEVVAQLRRLKSAHERRLAQFEAEIA